MSLTENLRRHQWLEERGWQPMLLKMTGNMDEYIRVFIHPEVLGIHNPKHAVGIQDNIDTRGKSTIPVGHPALSETELEYIKGVNEQFKEPTDGA